MLLFCDQGSVVADRLTSDFEWTWARFDRSGAFVEAVLIAGRNFVLDEQTIIAGREPINYAIIRRDGEELVVETDAGQKRIAVSHNYANVNR